MSSTGCFLPHDRTHVPTIHHSMNKRMMNQLLIIVSYCKIASEMNPSTFSYLRNDMGLHSALVHKKYNYPP